MAIVQNGGSKKKKPVQRTKSVLGQGGRPPTPMYSVLRGGTSRPKGKTLLQTLIDRRKATEAAIEAFKRRK